MARNKDEYDYYNYTGTDEGRDALIDELDPQASDPFAGVQSAGGIQSDEDAGAFAEGYGIPVDTTQTQDNYQGSVSNPTNTGAETAAAPYSYQGPWGGFDANSMAGGTTDRTQGNAKYYFTTVANKYDPYQAHNDPAVQQAMLTELNANPYGIKYSLSAEGDFMSVDPNEPFDGAYMGGRPIGGWGANGGDPENASNAANWQWQWQPGRNDAQSQANNMAVAGVLTPEGTQAASSAAPSSGTVAPISGTGSTVAPPVAPTANNGMSDSVRAYVEKILGGDPYAVDPNDPNIMAAQRAYERAQERGLQKNRSAMAERMAASGVGSNGGAMDSWVSNAYQGMGEANAENEANLVLDRQKSQLSQLQNALTVGAGILTADQETALRMKIAEMQNALGQGQLGYQYANMNTGDAQFYDNLALQYALAEITGNRNTVDAVR